MTARRLGVRRRSLWAKAGAALVSVSLSVSLWPARTAFASLRQGKQGPAQGQTKGTGQVNLTAASANVSEPGSPVRIRILRWSTDEERSPVVAALNPSRPAGAGPGPLAAAGLPPEAEPTQSAAGGGRGAARGLPAGTGRTQSAAAGRRGGAARGRRGDASVALSPVAALTAAIGRAPTIGYIWTNDITGYSIKYAYHASLPDGGERIILATDRRLGAYSTAWKPIAATPVTDYEFTVFEIRLDSRGLGEGKTSLTTKVILDNEAGTLALDGYPATSAILQNVKR
jgi:hypothetical protein